MNVHALCQSNKEAKPKSKELTAVNATYSLALGGREVKKLWFDFGKLLGVPVANLTEIKKQALPTRQANNYSCDFSAKKGLVTCVDMYRFDQMLVQAESLELLCYKDFIQVLKQTNPDIPRVELAEIALQLLSGD